jgi:hypothetical protein
MGYEARWSSEPASPEYAAKLEVKVKLSLCFNWALRHEGVVGEWKYLLHAFLRAGLDGGEWSASRPGHFTPQEKSPWCPLDRMLGGPQSRSESGDEEKHSQPLPELETPIIPPVAQRYSTELSRLLNIVPRNVNIDYSTYIWIYF